MLSAGNMGPPINCLCGPGDKSRQPGGCSSGRSHQLRCLRVSAESKRLRIFANHAVLPVDVFQLTAAECTACEVQGCGPQLHAPSVCKVNGDPSPTKSCVQLLNLVSELVQLKPFWPGKRQLAALLLHIAFAEVSAAAMTWIWPEAIPRV